MEFFYYYNRHMIDIREEKIPPCKCQKVLSERLSLTLLSLLLSQFLRYRCKIYSVDFYHFAVFKSYTLLYFYLNYMSCTRKTEFLFLNLVVNYASSMQIKYLCCQTIFLQSYYSLCLVDVIFSQLI